MPSSSGKKQKPLTDECLTSIFNTFAHKVVKDFPHLRERFVFYSASTDSFHGPLSARHGATTIMDNLQEEADAFLTDGIPETAFAGIERGYYVMAFISQQEERSMSSLRENQTQEITNILEHELGHLVVPGADFDFQRGHNRNFCESAADAFSMIRHYQATGSFGGALETTAWVRTLDFIASAQKLPLTTPVLMELKDLAAHHDLSKLTPVETANLAYRLSLQYSYSDAELNSLRSTFKPVQALLRSGDIEEALEACGKIILADHGTMTDCVVATGRALIEPFLNRRTYILNTQYDAEGIKDLSFTGVFWQQVRNKIRIKRPAEKELDRLQTLGAFDTKPDQIIDPDKYESIKNQIALANARDAYAAQAPRKKAGRKPSR